jgi:hypothetical protein
VAEPATDRPGEEHAVEHICTRIGVVKPGAAGLYVMEHDLVRGTRG